MGKKGSPNTQWIVIAQAKSESRPDAYHNIGVNRANCTIGCACWGWRKNRTCPHLNDLFTAIRRYASGGGDNYWFDFFGVKPLVSLDLLVSLSPRIYEQRPFTQEEIRKIEIDAAAAALARLMPSLEAT